MLAFALQAQQTTALAGHHMLFITELSLSTHEPVSSSDQQMHSVASSKTKNKMEGGLLLDVVVSQSTTIFQLLASEDQALLVRGNACKCMWSG
jgi:hypothetical protein